MGTIRYTFVRLELEDKLESVRGKTLGEADTTNVFAVTEANPKVTGIAGDVIEQSILGYPPDCRRPARNRRQGAITRHTCDKLLVSRSYTDLAAYYGCAVVPARVGLNVSG